MAHWRRLVLVGFRALRLILSRPCLVLPELRLLILVTLPSPQVSPGSARDKIIGTHLTYYSNQT